MKAKFTLLTLSVSLALSLTANLALAESGGIGSVTVEPNPAQAGQAVKITIAAEGDAPSLCGLAVEFGDGTSDKIKINGSESKFPVTLTKTYAHPGTYVVKAEGKKITTHFRCAGEATATVVVQGAAKAVAPTAAAVAPSCPPDYKMTGKPSRTGAYRCKAGKGAVAPEADLVCPPPLAAYKTNTTVGCQDVKQTKNKHR
ncbi:hypothetical protein PG1C_13150 [Rugosibacter aromaticivorans]|uniref:PKD domain-containing protein n=1 Tax=Rugosibacter aromaticivorans TaxID=1565605 RepID=A0A0C5J260_9PROT|nr:hypothetical protein [Rugosibacter aromaticivorans]AJP49122.1 hypothetical protein PG1C_13150 [Rugosibacter aromaticivorans]TBR14435.1 MAG: hypothetical protein EPO43_07500 [Rugosibacter sp.]